MRAYLPGATRKDTIQRPKWDREGYEAQQQQRAVERSIRSAKTEQALALDDDLRQKATAKVTARQAAMRDLLDAHPYLKRQYSREQMRVAK